MKVLDKAPPNATPLQDCTFEVTEHGIRLLASRCDRCGSIFFPTRRFCGRCGGRDLTRQALSAAGTIAAYSLIDRQSALSRIAPPYVQACVAMPEGLNVYTVLADIAPDAVSLGLKVEAALAEIGSGPNGEAIVAFVFRPATLEVSQ